MAGEELLTLSTPTLSVPPDAVAVTSVMLGEEEVVLRTPFALEPPVPVAVTSFIAGDDELVLKMPRLAELVTVEPKALAVTCSRLGGGPVLEIATESVKATEASTVRERNSA